MSLGETKPVVVTVKYYVLFFIATGYCMKELWGLHKTHDLNELLNLIGLKYGDDLRSKLFSPDGALKSTVWFILNGQRIESDNLLATSLKNGDELIITSPLLVGG